MSRFSFVNKRFSSGSETIIDQRKISSSIWKFYPMILEVGEEVMKLEVCVVNIICKVFYVKEIMTSANLSNSKG